MRKKTSVYRYSMTTIRVNWTLDKRAYLLIEKAAQHGKTTMSKLVSQLVLQKLQDPIKALEDEKRQLIIRANEIDDKIKHLEKLKDEKS